MTLTLRNAANKDRASGTTALPSFQHRHFAAIATMIRELPITTDEESEYQQIVADSFARQLQASNPKFDRTRFICACIPTGE